MNRQAGIFIPGMESIHFKSTRLPIFRCFRTFMFSPRTMSKRVALEPKLPVRLVAIGVKIQRIAAAVGGRAENSHLERSCWSPIRR